MGRALGAFVSRSHETLSKSPLHHGRTVVVEPVEIAVACAIRMPVLRAIVASSGLAV